MPPPHSLKKSYTCIYKKQTIGEQKRITDKALHVDFNLIVYYDV